MLSPSPCRWTGWAARTASPPRPASPGPSSTSSVASSSAPTSPTDTAATSRPSPAIPSAAAPLLPQVQLQTEEAAKPAGPPHIGSRLLALSSLSPNICLMAIVERCHFSRKAIMEGCHFSRLSRRYPLKPLLLACDIYLTLCLAP